MPNAEKIKKRIAEMTMTQADVAKELNIAAPTLSQKINGVRPFYLDEAEKLAEILKIEMSRFGEYFFKDEIA